MKTEWNGRDELLEDFDIESFVYGYCFVVRKADNVQGYLEFNHSPRVYYNFQPV